MCQNQNDWALGHLELTFLNVKHSLLNLYIYRCLYKTLLFFFYITCFFNHWCRLMLMNVFP